jgi:hypothetical protein
MSSVSRFPIQPDWSARPWQEALFHALDQRLRANFTANGVVVWSDDDAAECLVEWADGGLTCTCGSSAVCPHRARAWLEFAGYARQITEIARAHGCAAAVRYVAYREADVIDAAFVRPLREVSLWRDKDGTAHADVPHEYRHSWTIEWGYAGSGPADLAYSILVYFYGPSVAEALYQRFKEDVIARIPRDAHSFILPAEAIRSWVESMVSREVAS